MMVHCECASTIEHSTKRPLRTGIPSLELMSSWVNFGEPNTSPRLIFARGTIGSEYKKRSKKAMVKNMLYPNIVDLIKINVPDESYN